MGNPLMTKNFFLIASMVGWLIVGAALMYLFPAIADLIVSSELTHTWMKTLSQSDYNPALALIIGILVLGATVTCNILWLRRSTSKI